MAPHCRRTDPKTQPAGGIALSSKYIGGVLLAALALSPAVVFAADSASDAPPPAAPDPLAAPQPSFEPTAVDSPAADESWSVPGRVVVDARDDLGADDLAALASELGLRMVPSDLFEETRIEVAEVAPGSEKALIDRLSGDERIEGVEPLMRFRASYLPDDPMLKEQWHLNRVGAERAWDFTVGRGVVVAVVDTGIACEDHGPFSKGSDLARTTCVEGWNFVDDNAHANDDQGHGTHVAGTIAQSTNNGIGVAGLAFGASLMPVKVLNSMGWGTTVDVADGIRWAADHGAHVINLSLGSPQSSMILQRAINHAVDRGVVVVAAAGNTGGRVQFPGASDGVIGVSATDSDDRIARFSSRGEGVDIAAPGVGVLQQTICNKGRDKCERFQSFNGTSMAAPHVAGAAALVVSLGVTDPASVEEILRAEARTVDPSPGGKALFGAGILDAQAAVSQVTVTHFLVRLAWVVGLALWVGSAARRRTPGATSPFRPLFMLFALAAGPGLLFFAPWVLPRATLWVDVLARPIPDMDLFIGASLHRWLPLANVFVPLALTVLAFGSKTARTAIAGLSVGIAAYLGSLLVLGDATGPFGSTALFVWAALNALGCAWVARVNLEAAK